MIESNIDQIKSDRLLYALAMFIKNGKCEWNLQIPLNNVYSKLNDVFIGEDKSNKLKDYLMTWYENHAESAWYDSHLNEADTYCGYWSFESAAVAKILSIENITDSEYYPVL